MVLIPKPEKADLRNSSSLRLSFLISVLGKSFEYPLKNRLEREEKERQLSQRQFGFRKGRLAIDAVQYVLRHVRNCRRGYLALITFYVRNEFNTSS